MVLVWKKMGVGCRYKGSRLYIAKKKIKCVSVM